MGIWFEKILDSIYPKLKVCVCCLQKHDDGKICDKCLSEIPFNHNFHKINVKKIEESFATYL